jgi:hypothetical protein
MTDKLQRYNPNDTGRSGLTRNQAYGACVAAMRDGTSNPLALEEEFGAYAVAAARRAVDTGTAHILDRRNEVIQTLINEMHCADNETTRVSAGAHLLRAAVAYDLRQMETDRMKNPETRREAAAELRELQPDLFELLVDTWITEFPHPPRVIEFIQRLASHPSWESVMLEAGWVRR